MVLTLTIGEPLASEMVPTWTIGELLANVIAVMLATIGPLGREQETI